MKIEKEIAKRSLVKHMLGLRNCWPNLDLEIGGQYRWRRDGEKTLFNAIKFGPNFKKQFETTNQNP